MKKLSVNSYAYKVGIKKVRLETANDQHDNPPFPTVSLSGNPNCGDVIDVWRSVSDQYKRTYVSNVLE
jgi:hypothetical protein